MPSSPGKQPALDLNPLSLWNIAVTGTLNATFATITNSKAKLSTGIAVNCTNGGNDYQLDFREQRFTDGFDGNEMPAMLGELEKNAPAFQLILRASYSGEP